MNDHLRWLLVFLLALLAFALVFESRAPAQTRAVMETHTEGFVDMTCVARGQTYVVVCTQESGKDHFRTAVSFLDGNQVFDLDTVLFFSTLGHYEWECQSLPLEGPEPKEELNKEEEPPPNRGTSSVLAIANKEVNAKVTRGAKNKTIRPLI